MSNNDVYEEFEYRTSLLNEVTFNEAGSRFAGFYEWLKSEKITNSIITSLEESVDLKKILEGAGHYQPPKASTPEQIAAVGLFFVSEITKGKNAVDLADQYGVLPPYVTNSLQDHFNELINRFINPSIEYINRELKKKYQHPKDPYWGLQNSVHALPLPEIAESLEKFKQEHLNYESNAFIMMQFGKTKSHAAIVDSIRSTLKKFGLNGLRADDKEYHDDLFGNVLTYIYGCRFGIAVFERLEDDVFNPNVSLEVGYMRALRKPVCFLKDKTLKELQTDLVGKLYKSFDPQAPLETIPSELEKWLRDKDVITV